MTYTVDTPRSWRRRFRWPRLPLGEGQAAWTTRALMLLAPLLSFTLVEYLNYNNPWTDFTSLQTALNLAWYYLGELFFYFVLRRRASAVKWAMGIAWGLGMANHYLISFRGRTLFPRRLPHPPHRRNVAGNYDYRRLHAVAHHRRVRGGAAGPVLPAEREEKALPVAALCPGGRGRRGLSGRVFRHRVCGEPGH